MVYYAAKGIIRQTQVYKRGRDFGRESEEFMEIRESDGMPLLSVILSRTTEQTMVIFYLV